MSFLGCIIQCSNVVRHIWALTYSAFCPTKWRIPKFTLFLYYAIFDTFSNLTRVYLEIICSRQCQICHHTQEKKGFSLYLFELNNNSKLLQQLSYICEPVATALALRQIYRDNFQNNRPQFWKGCSQASNKKLQLLKHLKREIQQWCSQKEPGGALTLPNSCCALPHSLQKDRCTLIEQSNILLKHSGFVILSLAQ